MILVGHAVLETVVSDDDGPLVASVARDGILDWIAGLDLQRGDEILVVRGRKDDMEEA